MKLRALTIFFVSGSTDNLVKYVQYFQQVKEEIVWTKRVAFPPEVESVDKWVSQIPSVQGIIYSVIHLKAKNKLEKIVDTLSTDKSFYGSVLLNDPKYAEDVAKFIYSLDPEMATRIAVLINDDFLTTPYFPVGSANTINDSLSSSLIYVKEFSDDRAERALAFADEFTKKTGKEMGLRYLGIDASLSPWMEESVGKIIEDVSGEKLFSLGHLSTVSSLNRKIFDLVWKLKVTPIGFSEVMLPVAEDNVLMERVREGFLKLSQLMALTSVCVAGLDMVAVNRDLELYKKIIKDSIAIQFTKRRPYGIRIIPSSGEGEIYLKEYGKIPEIKII
ncbi:DUF711 family protein [Stygiolobus caldivivus]|uniref:DUF711 family protein n=1 Tax=Stygiolobus caldivivus TaxID=2824673 RepID=A0A8D5U8Q8_9CREN|nr:DUF711 family protein [Stygiolobus caldivivus]BCU70794.1 hypothetical protein KN1_20910 [Stygiolobus caldivivus]